MSLLFRHWLDEGYYEEDEIGDFTRLDSLSEIEEAAKEGNLYHHDGYSMTKISQIPEDYKITEIKFYKK